MSEDYNFLIITTSEIEYRFIQQTFQNVKSLDERRSEFSLNTKKCMILRADPGIFNIGYFLLRELMSHKFELVINAGICGSFREDLPTGTVARVETDCFADIGTEDGKNLFEMGLMKSDEYPFREGILHDHPGDFTRLYLDLPAVNAITVNRVTRSTPNFTFLRAKYRPDIETMEGASFFFVCAMERCNYVQIRAVSNIVGEGDRSKWDIETAMAALSETLKKTIR